MSIWVFFLYFIFLPVLLLEKKKGGTKSSIVLFASEQRVLFHLDSGKSWKIEHLAIPYLRTEDATPHTELLQVFDLPTLLPSLHIGMVRPRAS